MTGVVCGKLTKNSRVIGQHLTSAVRHVTVLNCLHQRTNISYIRC